MKTYIKNAIFVSLLALSNLFAGTFTIPEWVVNSCVFVMYNDTTAVGTGFLVGVKENDSTTFCYLVSAKHVIGPALNHSNQIILRVNLKEGNKAKVLHLPIIEFGNKKWIEHDNPAIDIAITPLAIWNDVENIDINMFSVTDSTKDYFADTSFIAKYKVNPGDKVFTLGLIPEIFNKDEKNLVLSRFGTVSALPEYELDLPGGKQKAYFLDCPAFGGNSGGPAYVLLERSETGALITGWRIGLLGVVTEFVPSPLRVRQKKTDLIPKTKIELIENTGISKVVPIDYVKELLFSKQQIDFRKAIINENQN